MICTRPATFVPASPAGWRLTGIVINYFI